MSRDGPTAMFGRLITRSMWAWAIAIIALGAGEPVPKRVNSAQQTVRLRDPTRVLTVQFDRSYLIFNPQDVLHAAIFVDLVESHEPAIRGTNNRPAKALVKWKLLPTGHNRSIAAGSQSVVRPAEGNEPAEVPLDLPLPRDEGVYSLRISAGARHFADSEIVAQIVVFDPSRPSSISHSGTAEKLVDSFAPAASGMFRKVVLDRSRTKMDQAWWRFLKTPRQRDNAASAVEAGDWNCVAYRLKVSHPGRPHRLELELSGTPGQTAFCCLLESDEQGKYLPLGPQAAVSLAAGRPDERGRRSDLSAESTVHQQIFWPNVREPVLLVAGRSADHPIEIGRVAVYEMGERLSPPRATGFDHSSLEWKQRLIGLHLDSSSLTRIFGAPMPSDTGGKQLANDWQSRWIAGNRLTEYLRYQQQNALLLSVPVDCGTDDSGGLVDSPVQAVHDNPAATQDDSSQRAYLELLFKLFDREDLVLVPELWFAATFPSLERLVLDGPASGGNLQLVNAVGRTRAEVDEAMTGASANYNILSPRVQQAVLETMREFVDHYAAHPSFGGVAFELGIDSVLQLPGIEWGYDPDTVRTFEQATRLEVPRSSRPAEQQKAAYRYLTTTARREWIRYRCAEVARFHRKLAELVLSAKPDAQVYFSGRLWTDGSPAPEEALLDFVRAGGGPSQMLQGQGLDFSQPPYATDARVTVLRPLVQLNSQGQLPQAAAATLNHSPAIDALYRVASPGGLLYSTPAEAPAAQADVEMRRAAAPAAVRAGSRQSVLQNYSHLLATLDVQAVFDGSSTLPQAPTDSALRMRTVIGNLPNLVFHVDGPQPQPVVVRRAQHGSTTWLYAVNDSSLPLAIDLVLECPASTVCRMLDGSRPPPLESLAGNQTPGKAASGNRARLHIDLAGNGLWACRFERAGIGVVDTRITLAGESLADVERSIERLTSRMQETTSLARAGSGQLSNPGFEQRGARTNELPGWELPVQQAGWSLDEDNPHSGHRSLAISATANITALATALPMEGNRFVAMSLWLRSDKPRARVRIVFEATIDGALFHHEQPVEASQSWQQHMLRVDPLPVGPVRNARLSVIPVDSCKLWVDDVEIGSQSFSTDEVRQLTKTLSSVKLAWEAGRYADCQRLLDGYWGQLLLAEPAQSRPPSDRPRFGDRLRNKFRR
jgi:hypothetical protein